MSPSLPVSAALVRSAARRVPASPLFFPHLFFSGNRPRQYCLSLVYFLLHSRRALLKISKTLRMTNRLQRTKTHDCFSHSKTRTNKKAFPKSGRSAQAGPAPR